MILQSNSANSGKKVTSVFLAQIAADTPQQALERKGLAVERVGARSMSGELEIAPKKIYTDFDFIEMYLN